MQTSKWRFIVALSGLLSCAVWAHEVEEGKGQLGKVSFANSCAPAVQADLQRAVAMLHSFWYSAGEKTFRNVLAHDASCGIAGWGIAAILMSNPLAGQGATPKAAEAAQAAVEQARRAGIKTQRERDYVEAVAAYYADFANRPERERQLARSRAYEELAARYPDDDEAQIFSALYVAATQTQADQTYAAYLKAARSLERYFVKYPDHPGVAHYLIHSYDAPPIAQQGLTAAKRYASIAPDAPHALHMPSHIFTRVGAWPESAATNMRAFSAAIKGDEPDEAYHASDYAVYAYLQLGRDREAQRVYDAATKVEGVNLARFTAPYAVAAMTARLATERGDWAAAARLEVPTMARGCAFCEAMTVFARTLGKARSGDIAGADQESQRLAVLHKTLTDVKNNYWATEVEVQRLTAAAWLAQARSQPEDALRLMRAAADLEDRNEKHIVSPGRVVPARELLGELLMEQKQAAAAFKEFELSQQREPHRFRGYAGAAQAAAAVGDRARAAQNWTALRDMARDADSPRPELEQARLFLASR